MRKRKNPYKVDPDGLMVNQMLEKAKHDAWEKGYKAGRKDEREISGWKPCLPLGSSD